MFACQGWLGVCGAGSAGLVEMKAGGFVDDVDCMGRWPSYGGYAVAMGEWPACGDLSKRMGKCARHGNGAGVWDAARPYGKPKSHQNQEYGNCDGLRTCIFS